MKAALKKTFEIIAAILFILLMIGFVVLLTLPAKSANKDYRFLDSTFRAMEAKPAGGFYDGKGRVFYPDANVALPRIGTDNKTKTFLINNITVYNYGLIATAVDWVDMHNCQTNRTFILNNVNFYNQANIGLLIEGSHRSTFNNLSFYNCRVGAKFILCLEGYATQLQTHQTKDTGVFVGYGNCNGCTNYNSQSNNFRIEGFRDYGTGKGIALIYKGVSGGVVTSLTNEGHGRDVFLQVDASGSNFMKDFTASHFHIECFNQTAVIEAKPNGSKFYFSDFFPQAANTIISAKGLGSIYVQSIYYIPTNGNKFQNLSGESGSLWWQFTDCEATNRTIYNDANWIIGNGSTKPRPFAPGQTTNNSGSNRLYEIPCFTN